MKTKVKIIAVTGIILLLAGMMLSICIGAKKYSAK